MPSCFSTWCLFFAVTQISHTLLGRLTPLGVLQTTLLLLAVWWVWVYTSSITNWLNPEMPLGAALIFAITKGNVDPLRMGRRRIPTSAAG